MAIQAQLYPENFGVPLGVGQDRVALENINIVNNNNGACSVLDRSCLHQFNQLQNLDSSIQFLPCNNFNNIQSQQPMALYQSSVSALLEKQRIEFDQLIVLQNERLSLAIQEQRKQQGQLLKKYESKIEILLKQKDEEIAQVTNRTIELQNFIKRMEMENQTWQRAVTENESIVTFLNNKIEQLRKRKSACAAADDAESCCINRQEQEEGAGPRMPRICRCCNSRAACMIMLPCKHLSACQYCEAFLDACPVCRMVKEGSIEALI